MQYHISVTPHHRRSVRLHFFPSSLLVQTNASIYLSIQSGHAHRGAAGLINAVKTLTNHLQLHPLSALSNESSQQQNCLRVTTRENQRRFRDVGTVTANNNQ